MHDEQWDGIRDALIDADGDHNGPLGVAFEQMQAELASFRATATLDGARGPGSDEDVRKAVLHLLVAVPVLYPQASGLSHGTGLLVRDANLHIRDKAQHAKEHRGATMQSNRGIRRAPNGLYHAATCELFASGEHDATRICTCKTGRVVPEK